MIVITSTRYKNVHYHVSYRRPTNFVHVSSPRSPRFVALASFRFISSRFVLSHLRLISFYSMPHAAVHATMRENAVSDVFSFPYIYFFFLFVGAFYSAVRSAEHGAATEGREGGEVLGFIPVVNNIFIAASSEEMRGCNSKGCLPFPCTRRRHNRAVPRHNSFVSD